MPNDPAQDRPREKVLISPPITVFVAPQRGYRPSELA